MTKPGFSGRKKRDGLGRRCPRGAGVRDEFGRPTDRLVALRHGHRARRGSQGLAGVSDGNFAALMLAVRGARPCVKEASHEREPQALREREAKVLPP